MTSSDEPVPGPFVRTTRLDAFSDGVIAIAITLLVLELAIPASGQPLDRVLAAWPVLLAYVVSFLTIGAAWLVHTAITDRLVKADATLLRLNLLVLFAISVLPFPTRLMAESLEDVEGERVFVAMYGVTLLLIRVMLHTLDAYARREQLYAPRETDATKSVERTIWPVVAVYGAAILIGVVLPAVAVGIYCLIAIWLIVPFRELRRLLFRRD